MTGRPRGPKPRDGEPSRKVTLRIGESAYLEAERRANAEGVPLAVWLAVVIRTYVSPLRRAAPPTS